MLKIILFLSSYVLIAQSFEIIDLTHSFDHNGTTAYWKMNDAFQYTSSLKTQTADYYYETNSFCASEHGGTHLDAPVHFAKGKFGVDQIPLEQLVSAPYIVDVSENAKDDSDFQLEVKHLTNAEEKQGRIPDGSILLIDNGKLLCVNCQIQILLNFFSLLQNNVVGMGVIKNDTLKSLFLRKKFSLFFYF